MTILKNFSIEDMSAKPIVVFDLDGTIVFDGKSIENNILPAL